MQQFHITGFKTRAGYARRSFVSSFSSTIISFDIYSAAGDLGLHHGLDGLFALACDANGELIERGHHGVMIEVTVPVIFVQLRFKLSSFFSSEMEDGTSAMHRKSQQSSWGDDRSQEYR